MLCEHEPQASVSTAFSGSPKFSRREKHRDEKKENNLLTLIIKKKILFARAITTSTARASSLSPLSYTNTIFNQSACVLSQECFLNQNSAYYKALKAAGARTATGTLKPVRRLRRERHCGEKYHKHLRSIVRTSVSALPN